MRALLLLLLAVPAAAQQVQVNLSPSGPTVGDRVEAVITLRVDSSSLSAEPRFPSWSQTWGEAEVVGRTEPRRVSRSGGTAVFEQRLVLAAFRPGKVELPPVQIAVPLGARTVQVSTPAGLSLDVRSVLPRGEKDLELKPPKPPVPLPIGERFWWTLAVMSAVSLALGLLLFLRRGKGDETAMERPDLPPLGELLAALDRLAGEPSAVRAHTGLSLAFRRYLGRALAFHAAESTTSEIHRCLLSHRLPAPLVRQSVDLLRSCDLVKFARIEETGERTRERLDAARRIAGEADAYALPAEPLPPLEATG